MKNAGIIRNRLKIEGTIKNARAFFWRSNRSSVVLALRLAFVGGAPIVNRPKRRSAPRHERGIRCALEGFEETGIQLCGLDDLLRLHAGDRLVNDHINGCPAGDSCGGAAGKASRKRR